MYTLILVQKHADRAAIVKELIDSEQRYVTTLDQISQVSKQQSMLLLLPQDMFPIGLLPAGTVRAGIHILPHYPINRNYGELLSHTNNPSNRY